MSIPKIEYFRDSDGDWARLYYDGKLVSEGHSINERDVLRFFAEKFEVKLDEYYVESNEFELNGDEIFYDDMPKWLQDYYDEFYTEIDGH